VFENQLFLVNSQKTVEGSSRAHNLKGMIKAKDNL